ncbi:hypothetical protein C8Q77DRAFT_498994 [Trametes polyzona]|nr:hypothetical protein C8Q77DRAFT_498994 [Trametes polyzona]
MLCAAVHSCYLLCLAGMRARQSGVPRGRSGSPCRPDRSAVIIAPVVNGIHYSPRIPFVVHRSSGARGAPLRIAGCQPAARLYKGACSIHSALWSSIPPRSGMAGAYCGQEGQCGCASAAVRPKGMRPD